MLYNFPGKAKVVKDLPCDGNRADALVLEYLFFRGKPVDGLIRLVNAQLLYFFCRRFVDPGELNTLVFLQDERLVVGVIVGDAVLRHSHVLIMREDTRCVEQRRRDLDFRCSLMLLIAVVHGLAVA